MDQPLDTWIVEVDADTRPLELQLTRLTNLGAQFGRSLTSAFESIALKGRSLGDVLRSLALRLSQLVFRAAFKPLENAIGGAFQKLIGGALGFAAGGVIRQGLPVPFAAGGVISTPTYFPLRGGRTGLMGERGAEAILPLARGPDGRLGVRSSSTAGATVQVNITTPDIESFRRSETQLAALLARALAQGQRNL
jgi:phage-related minor tail protein